MTETVLDKLRRMSLEHRSATRDAVSDDAVESIDLGVCLGRRRSLALLGGEITLCDDDGGALLCSLPPDGIYEIVKCLTPVGAARVISHLLATQREAFERELAVQRREAEKRDRERSV